MSVSEVLILLLADAATMDPACWPIIFASLPLNQFDWQQAVQLLKCLSSCFPVPLPVMGHVMQLARRIVCILYK